MRINLVCVIGVICALSIFSCNSANAEVFGRYNCKKPKVPCDGYSISDSKEWADMGNKCLYTAFGYQDEEGFFDEFAGLDERNCLTATKTITNKRRKVITPHCCIKEISPDNCALHCFIDIK